MTVDKERLFKISLVLGGVLGSLYVLSYFLPALLLAGVVAFAIEPLAKKIRAAHFFGHSSILFFLVVGLFLAISVPFFFILYRIYSMILWLGLEGEGKKAALETFNRYRRELVAVLNSVVTRFGLKKTVSGESILGDGAQQILSRVLEGATYLISQIPDLLFSFAVFLVALFLFMRHSSRIGSYFYSSHFLRRQECQKVVQVLRQTSYAAVFSSLITGLVQSTTVSAGAALMTDFDVTLIFVITFLCSFIPVIGAAPIAFALSGISFIRGDSGAGVGLLIVGMITGTVDNVIRVALLKMNKDDLHPFVELLAVVGGVIVLGLPGLFLGPVIISATTQLMPVLLSHPPSFRPEKNQSDD